MSVIPSFLSNNFLTYITNQTTPTIVQITARIAINLVKKEPKEFEIAVVFTIVRLEKTVLLKIVPTINAAITTRITTAITVETEFIRSLPFTF